MNKKKATPFSTLLKNWRLENGLKQKEIVDALRAKRIKINQSRLSYWENAISLPPQGDSLNLINTINTIAPIDVQTWQAALDAQSLETKYISKEQTGFIASRYFFHYAQAELEKKRKDPSNNQLEVFILGNELPAEKDRVVQDMWAENISADTKYRVLIYGSRDLSTLRNSIFKLSDAIQSIFNKTKALNSQTIDQNIEIWVLPDFEFKNQELESLENTFKERMKHTENFCMFNILDRSDKALPNTKKIIAELDTSARRVFTSATTAAVYSNGHNNFFAGMSVDTSMNSDEDTLIAFKVDDKHFENDLMDARNVLFHFST